MSTISATAIEETALPSERNPLPTSLGWAAVGMAVTMSLLSLLRHWHYLSQAFDLGFYVQDVWAIGHGIWHNTVGGFHVFADHFSPVLVLLAPVTYLPLAETLLVIQAVGMAFGLFPAYRIGARFGGARLGRLAALWYGLSAAIWHAVMYDFHPVTLGVPLLMWLIAEVDTGQKPRKALLIGLGLALIREDLAVLAGVIMIQGALLHRNRRLAWQSVVPASIGVIYIAGISLWSGGMGGYHFWTRFSQGSGGFSIMNTLAGAVGNLARPDVIVSFAAVLLPVLVFPALLGWRRSWPGLAIILLNGAVSYGAQGSIYYQYFAPAVPFLIWGAANGWSRMRRDRVGLATVGTVSAFLLLGPIFFLGYGLPDRFATTILSAGDRRAIDELMVEIPDSGAVSATDRLVPHLATRAEIYPFPGPMICSLSLIFDVPLTSYPPHIVVEWDDAVPGADWASVLPTWGYTETVSNDVATVWTLEGDPPASVPCPPIGDRRRTIALESTGANP